MLKQWTSYKDIGDALITAGAGGGVFSAIYHSVNYVRGAYNEVGIGSFIINILPTFLTIAGRLMY